MFIERPPELAGADCSRIRFYLDFLSPCTLPAGALLRLRRPLRRAAGLAFQADSDGGRERSARLFDPSPSFDPVASRKFQKPAPPFVICPSVLAARSLDVGDRLELEVLFVGAGIPSIGDFLACLEVLGQNGLSQGEGRFEVTEAASLGLQGETRLCWRQTTRGDEAPVPDVHTLEMLLQEVGSLSPPLRLEMMTPARLVSREQVLRSPTFPQLFAFMLRRVTSMLHAHCHVELLQAPQEVEALQALAAQVKVSSAAWEWRDWREMGAGRPIETIGGTVGSLRLAGPEWENLAWVLGLGALFGIGKGAAYGAGRYGLQAEKR